ncbi:hypothetical protein CDD81_1548 [Ophiocordyceps australis]|uniref:aldehyde dehydrogenase (NAD(+)) n=1 Tax=Ophiocordyceps australis TaxID=1399860 RepID=A0A2C5XYS7_9HYPO|nr:hypothetical protein CDD81_1548 [Ophiocordyceps australis]
MAPPAIHSYFNGQPQPSSSSPSSVFTSLNPATESVLATVHTTTPAQLQQAIDSAAAAFATWSQTPALERSRILLGAVALLRARNDELALVETRDTGKPLQETLAVDVHTGADVLEYYAKLVADGMPGQHTPLSANTHIYTTLEPIGICAGIGAWNYPLQIALWKSAPCLAAGNCMVYKPSEVTPLHANRLAAIYSEAGLPPGVFNVVYGDGPSVGEPLVSHPAIAKVSFTGQVSTGRRVAAQAAADMKGITMELGGKSPLLILPDADIDDAADVAMAANFFSSGQVCTNGTRVFVPDSLLEPLKQAIIQRCRLVCMDMPEKQSTTLGPLVSAAHRNKVLDYINHGLHVDAAKVVYNGNASLPPHLAKQPGYWVAPMVFECTDDMRIAREEVFGPVMCLLPYHTAGCRSPMDWLPDLVRRANATPLGLAAGVVSSDLGLAQAVVARLHAGITWINTWGDSPAEMPVGGWKLSGTGVENGHEGIRAYVRTKSTFVNTGKTAAQLASAKL